MDNHGAQAGIAEATDHDGGAIMDVSDRLLQRVRNFIDHVALTVDAALPAAPADCLAALAIFAVQPGGWDSSLPVWTDIPEVFAA